MVPGWKTTEYWLAIKWLCLTACAFAALFHSSWTIALCSMPAVVALVYMSAAISNNYGENRYLLKLSRITELSEEEQPSKHFGFRVVSAGVSEEDCEE